MDALAERHVRLAIAPIGIKPAWHVEVGGVTIGGRDREEDKSALGQMCAAQFGIACRQPPKAPNRWFEAKQLLDDLVTHSEEARVGEEVVRTCIYEGVRAHS